jgi:hypothetical protein
MLKIICFMRKVCFAIIYLLLSNYCYSQLAINTDGSSPDASSMLDIVSAAKGVFIPRIALTSIDDGASIGSPTTSLLVYNPGTGGLSPA